MSGLRRPGPESMSSWFTRGRRLERGSSYVVVDQAYVQYHNPERDLGRRPIVFFHGGGMTGALWESTPDGRPGWAALAIRAGFPVVLVDTVDGGRSGRAPDGDRAGDPEWKTADQLWTRYRFGATDDWPSRRAFNGQQFPVEALDALLAAHVPRRRSTAAVEIAAVEEVVERVGPCHVVAHSYGASLVCTAFAWLAPHLLKTVLLEPAPFDVDVALPAERVLIVWGDFFAVTEEPRWFHAPEAFRSSTATGLDLVAAGLPGASHLMMSDRHSDAVFEQVLNWIVGDTAPDPDGPAVR